jgi:hypothetical protein
MIMTIKYIKKWLIFKLLKLIGVKYFPHPEFCEAVNNNLIPLLDHKEIFILSLDV